jgi:hypothetical protein
MGPKCLIYITENNEHCIHIKTYVNICSFYPEIKVGQLPHLALREAPPLASCISPVLYRVPPGAVGLVCPGIYMHTVALC